MSVEKYALVIYLLSSHLLLFAFRSWLHWKKTGSSPITFQKNDDAHDFNGGVFRFLMLLPFMAIGMYIAGAEVYQYLMPIWYLEVYYLKVVGWGLMILGMPFAFIAQLQMGNSWRIGIDARQKTALIQTGLYRYSRNPIYLGILLAHLGFFMVLPNVLSFLYLVLSYTTVQLHVRLEEAYLKEKHGVQFLEYCEKVRRWL